MEPSSLFVPTTRPSTNTCDHKLKIQLESTMAALKEEDDRSMNDKSDDSSNEENEGEQVRISFELDPSISDESLRVPSEPIAVPSGVGRKGLSAVINHLLDRVEDDEDDVIPFDFLISNKLLRTGVETAARRHGMSLEQTVKITYFPAETAPKHQGESDPQPDWISGLEYNSGYLVSGNYSGAISLFKTNNDTAALECLATATAHSGPIKCLAIAHDDTSEVLTIATGSLDHSLVTHSFADSEMSPHAEYTDGHSSSINCVDLQKEGNLMSSGDWDGGLCLWDYKNVQADNVTQEEPSRKQTKTASTERKTKVATPTVAPKAVLQAHSSNISAVSWISSNSLVTSSWDHSIKVWDMEGQDCLLTLNGSRVVSCMDTSRHSQVVATGHPDCTVRLWDVRVGKSTGEASSSITTDTTLKPRHKAWISGVKWSPTNPYVLASTSHDGAIKIWDIRSSLPLFSVRAHEKEEKGLCLTYGKNGIIYAGGTDCIVKEFSGSTSN